ncbi:hypothetical protein QV08_11330 [Gallibacterium salpingitidis]|uniref:thiaminase II n=1 Tax=Gallibacterium salpingitidis TaxID=505341 RepID=UPI0008050D36|nr:thiaminase II [Gallibacterium salpingitidis]OBX05852.1 hypothetical protein QV08_11330 [Gallibacterium salpingitidis]WKS99535.1 thiaminase II [Gallibacterium salpingitidis]
MSLSQQLRQNAMPYWQQYVEHPFVQQLATGTLAKASFQHYLIQDYHYLLHYSRALALAMYKCDNFRDLAEIETSLQAILAEVQLHIGYCQEWQISPAQLEQTAESPACVAYTRYVLDCGMQGTLAELYAAILPCTLGYAEIGKWIVDSGVSPSNNPYQSWIDMYASAEFQQAAVSMQTFFASLCQSSSAAQQAKLQHIFTTATRMEIAFWQMGLDRS